MVQAKLHIVQIVRNWGQVGGMESYVWQLSHELARQNYCVTVICEREHAKPEIQGIEVIELGRLLQKPRWVMYWRFANRVNEKIKHSGLAKDCVIHSHERSISHDITTFHSMPFATIKEKSWLKRLSIRVWVYLKMENRELGGLPNQSVCIVPVSWRIAIAIQKYYPHVTKSIERPIFPGVASLPLRPIRCIPKDGGTIGFFGTEWNRKGFALFIKIAEQIGLHNARKKDSTGICFIGERPFREFLNRYLPRTPGPIKTPEGKTVGEHMGLAFFTLGQRKGIGLGGSQDGNGDAWYVARKDVANNTLYVAQGHEHPWLLANQLSAIDTSWVAGAAPAPGQYSAKTRYRQADSACSLVAGVEGPLSFQLTFPEAQWAVTPGQSAVLYDGDICLGGGIISA